MEYILIIFVAFGAAVLTFFSGFGLGTILLPAFAIFFPIEVAIGLTAVVHLTNNLFKFGLLRRSVNFKVVVRFALPAAIAAFLGAYLLGIITKSPVVWNYSILGVNLQTSLINIIIALLLLFFSIVEINKRLKKISFGNKLLPLGGLLSGFFGGLSGHQGALRSMFLLRVRLNKEAFIATGIAAAIVIDISRLTVYGYSFFVDKFVSIDDYQFYILLIVATLSAFAGSLLGRRLLKKVTMRLIQLSVGILIIVFAILLGFGIM
jgi:uncharacterized membrane protein YfcA